MPLFHDLNLNFLNGIHIPIERNLLFLLSSEMSSQYSLHMELKMKNQSQTIVLHQQYIFPKNSSMFLKTIWLKWFYGVCRHLLAITGTVTEPFQNYCYYILWTTWIHLRNQTTRLYQLTLLLNSLIKILISQLH